MVNLITTLQPILFGITFTLWIFFIANLIRKTKTQKLGWFFLLLTICVLISFFYYKMKNSPPAIYTFKKLCGTYEYNFYESTRRGRGHYIYYFNLENYGAYEEWANHEKIAQIGQYPFHRKFDLNTLIKKQKVCLYVSFNIFKQNVIHSTLAIDPLTQDYPFEYKTFCGTQTSKRNLEKIHGLDEQPYEVIFNLDDYGQLAYSHYRGNDHLIGDNQFTNSNQRVCLLTELPKRSTHEPLVIHSNNILLLELKDQPHTKID